MAIIQVNGETFIDGFSADGIHINDYLAGKRAAAPAPAPAAEEPAPKRRWFRRTKTATPAPVAGDKGETSGGANNITGTVHGSVIRANNIIGDIHLG